MSFASLKKSSQNDFERLQKEMEKQSKKGKGSYEDTRFWKLEADKTGTGSATIRFLMQSEGESTPFAEFWSHYFQGKGGYYVENCPTTNGQRCPVCDANNQLWEESGNDDSHPNRKIARDRKRKLNYISNILVISDPANPENEGKVFLFKYGKKIMDKIKAAIKPADADDPKFNPFDYWSGANFKLKVAKESGYPSYDKSSFSMPSPLLGGDEKQLEAIWAKQYPLQPFVSGDQFKPYEELAAKFDKVLKGTSAIAKAESAQPSDFRSKMTSQQVEEEVDKRFGPATTAKKDEPAPFKATKPGKPNVEEDESEEESMSWFKKLAEED